jgi:uncharacterized membrane protein
VDSAAAAADPGAGGPPGAGDAEEMKMAFMHRRKLLKLLDTKKITEAIQAAEKKTSGEIRVSVSPFFYGKIRPVAEKAFRRLGMARTRERNGILFFIVPARRRFVVLGDEGIHAKVGQEFWKRIAAALSERFQEGDFTGGLIKGIEEVGEHLAEHFPFNPLTDVNELPDDVDFAGKKKKQDN